MFKQDLSSYISKKFSFIYKIVPVTYVFAVHSFRSEISTNYISFLVLTVRKPRMAKSIEDQTAFVTKNAFQIIYNSRDNIKKYLLDGGFVYNMKFPDFKWRFLSGGETYFSLMVTKCHDKFYLFICSKYLKHFLL